MPMLSYENDPIPMSDFGAIDQRDPAQAEPDLTVGETLGAAFRQDNTVGSALSDKLHGIDVTRKEDDFTGDVIWGEIKGTPYEDHWDRFAGVFNRPAFEAMKAQIDMEEEDRKTLAASGWLGTAASIGAAIVDLPSLIPGGTVAREVSIGGRLAKTAFSGAATGALAAGVSEAALQASQQIRPKSESALAVGAGAVLGGALGLGAATLLSGLERRSALKAAQEALSKPVDADVALSEFKAGLQEGQSVGAAAVERENLADYAIEGRSARAIGKSTAKLNPVLRAAHSPSAAHRALMADMQETGFYLEKNVRGEGNIAAESAMKYWDRGALGQGLEAMRGIFGKARKAGFNQTYGEFRENISRAMRRGDDSVEAPIAEAARNWRANLFDPLKEEAIKVGLLPEDVDVKTATSYLSRLWNRNKLEAGEARFKQIVRPWLDDQIRDLEFKQDEIRIGNKVVDAEKLRERYQKAQDRIAKLEERLDERKTSRTRRLGAIDKAAQTRLGVLADRLPDSVVRALRGSNETRAMVETVREARKVERSANKKQPYAQRFPVLSLIKDRGGVRVGSTLDSELRAIDVTPKSHPGLFKKDGGIGDIDNFVHSEEGIFVTLPGDGNGYVDRNALLDAIRSEVGGSPLQDVEQMDVEAVAENLARTAEDWLRSVGLDPAATVKEVRDFIQRVQSTDRNVGNLDSRIERFARELEDFDKSTDSLVNERDITAAEARAINEELTKLEAEIDAVSDLANASPRVKLVVDYAMTKRDLFKKKLSERSLRSRVEAVQRIEKEGTANPEMLAELMAKEADLERLDGEIKGLIGKADKLEPMVPKMKREIPDFVSEEDRAAYLDETVNDIFNQLTGRARQGTLSYDLTVSARGPLKERTFNIPDHLVEDFLENDVELIARRYARIMSADVELARMSLSRGFSGKPDLSDAVKAVRDDYQQLRDQVMASGLSPENMAKELRRLGNLERRDVTDVEGVRDILRGQYRLDIQHTNFARITQAALTFNYLRAMGGVLAASIGDVVRLPMTHGLRRYMGEGIAPLLTNLKGVKMSVAEAKLLGAVTERVLESRIATMAEIADPYAMNSPFERFLNSAASVFTKMTLLPFFNDMNKSIASVLIQNRIIRNGLADFENLAPAERKYMGFLGLDQDTAARIGQMFSEFGQVEGNVHIPNFEHWTDDVAKRAFTAAVNKDVDGIIVTKGAGDTPLFMHTPAGRALGQFKSFAIASNQRVLMRGVQEGPGSVMTGLIGLTALGMLTYWLKQKEAGREISDNPGTWISEGMDRAGFLSVAFELNNTWEKLGGPGFYYLAAKTFPDRMQKQPASRYAVRSAFGALLGPTFGLGTDIATATGAGAKMLRDGEIDLTGGDVGTFRRLTPFASLPYWRWIIDGSVVPAAKQAVQ